MGLAADAHRAIAVEDRLPLHPDHPIKIGIVRLYTDVGHRIVLTHLFECFQAFGKALRISVAQLMVTGIKLQPALPICDRVVICRR